MPDSSREMESLLKGLAPVQPDDALWQKVAQDLDADAAWMTLPVRRWPRWLAAAGWSGLGAAAAVVALSLLLWESAPANGEGIAAPTVTTTREMLGAEDVGIRLNENLLPEQHVKIWTVERRAWIDPVDGAAFEVEMPREETVILPVNYQ